MIVSALPISDQAVCRGAVVWSLGVWTEGNTGGVTGAVGEPLTWDMLLDGVRSGSGSAARHEVAVWAVGRVRGVLGDRWLRRWQGRFGRPPFFIRDVATDAVAYSQLIEVGLRLYELAGVPGIRKITREWSTDVEENRRLHVWLQLEVAALAAAQGATVRFEADLPDFPRPADVVITSGAESFAAECFSVFNDMNTAHAMAYDHALGFQLEMLALDADTRISGHWYERPPLADLIAEARRVAELVSADGVSRSVIRPGIQFDLAPWAPSSDSLITLEGPSTSQAGWYRASTYIRGKADDWTNAPVPVWLRFNLLDGTWLLSDWAQKSLPDKTEWMAALVAQSVRGTGISGVVISSGILINPQAGTEDYTGTGGIIGLRRQIDALRARETIIIPLSRTGARHTAMWRAFYTSEPEWLDRALRAASLPDLDAITAG